QDRPHLGWRDRGHPVDLNDGTILSCEPSIDLERYESCVQGRGPRDPYDHDLTGIHAKRSLAVFEPRDCNILHIESPLDRQDTAAATTAATVGRSTRAGRDDDPREIPAYGSHDVQRICGGDVPDGSARKFGILCVYIIPRVVCEAADDP